MYEEGKFGVQVINNVLRKKCLIFNQNLERIYLFWIVVFNKGSL